MGSRQKMETSNVPTIPEYFKGKNIFITGGSGFMGQALVEKFLYSCPELNSIYLLMRQKRRVRPEDRLEKLYSSDCFDRLRKEKPTLFREKIHIVPGNVTELGLGLSVNDRALLIDKINVIFHAAASVRFNDNLDYAAKMNIRGTRELIELAKEMKHLSSFVHVSTCYSNTNQEVIDEMLYPPLADWRELLEVCEKFEDTLTIQSLTPKYLNGMPNTYVFTKQLAEHVVCEQRGKLPIVIIRPSIVVSSMEEPAPGWINNFNGPATLSIAYGAGLYCTFYAKNDTQLNYIPLDVCIRNFIVVAWARGTEQLQDIEDIKIYNCCVSKDDEMSVKKFLVKGYSSLSKYPLQNIVWNPRNPSVTDKFIVYFISTVVYSVVPAIFIDSILLLLGKKPKLLGLQRKLYSASLVMFYYLSNNWTLKNGNFLKLRENIKLDDRKEFYYSTDKLYETDYIDVCTKGAKKYLLKEDVSDMSKARANAYRMKLLDRVVKIVFFMYVLWWIFYAKFTRNVYQKLFTLQDQKWNLPHINE